MQPNRPLVTPIAGPKASPKGRPLVAPRAVRAKAAGDWDLDLGTGGRAGAPAQRTNQAHLNGRNLRYAGDNNAWAVEVPYLKADLVDLTPADPLSIWSVGSFKIRVQSGQVKLSQAQANQMIQAMLPAGGPVKQAHVAFKRGNKAEVKGTAHWTFIPIPFTVRARVALKGPTDLRVQPETVRVFGLPVLWAVKLFGGDLSKKLPLPKDGSVTIGKGEEVRLDLAKTSLFEGQLREVSIGPNGAQVTIGDAPPASLAGPRTNNVPNYCQVIAEGEVALESAIVRDATVMTIDNTPADPYGFNHWDAEGYARIESGQVILDEARLAKRFAGTGDFSLKKAKLSGTDLVVEGSTSLIGISIPLSFKIGFGVSGSGQLKLTPRDVKAAGMSLGFVKSKLLSTLAAMPGCRRDGDGVVLDMRKSASVALPPLKAVTAEAGRIVLRT